PNNDPEVPNEQRSNAATLDTDEELATHAFLRIVTPNSPQSRQALTKVRRSQKLRFRTDTQAKSTICGEQVVETNGPRLMPGRGHELSDCNSRSRRLPPQEGGDIEVIFGRRLRIRGRGAAVRIEPLRGR